MQHHDKALDKTNQLPPVSLVTKERLEEVHAYVKQLEGIVYVLNKRLGGKERIDLEILNTFYKGQSFTVEMIYTPDKDYIVITNIK